ncbi:hypothetical protein R5W24_003412 [Gemmata sp. JC717]|uniref:hypothetical protein n=1 Tax=Gemmata algarum TaxID=2975278 RepID=UPI0021BA79D9|nr:hypothetical protein [Gemmata algarum]MDY3554293.1 hypothetical protein [Gemmata algarum]
MRRIVLDAELRAKLNGATAVVEVADEAGNVVGRYFPDEVLERIMARLLPPLSSEELAAARREMLAHGGVTSAELLAGLDAIKREWESRR